MFWNPLDKPIQKLSFGIQFHQDLMEKTKEQADAKWTVTTVLSVKGKMCIKPVWLAKISTCLRNLQFAGMQKP